MKIIYHDPEGDVTYTRIARVDFSPEVDIKLNSLPVDMLTVDIITQDTLERGWLISLKNDVDTLFAKFKITKVQRINKDTLRVEATSPLWLMDWWTVGAERIQTTAGAAVYDLFNGLPKSGYLSIIPYTLPTELASININGFAPEQTARERLLWLCLAMGAWVQQSFCNGLVFHALPDFSNHDLTQGALLPYKKTYWKPTTQLGDPVHVVWMELIGTISTTETPDTESGTDEGGTTYYWDYITHGYVNPDEDAPGGSEVKITGVSLLNNDYQHPTFSKLGALYMNRMEITAEIIDNGDVQPGDVVRVYTDEDLIYCGVVTQCVFTFGQQSKARLTVSAFSDELPIQIVRVTFTADDVPLGQETEVYPEGDTWEVDAPDIDGYTPDTPSITGSTGGNYSIDYTKIPLEYIKIMHPPTKTEYFDDESIDKTGLVVVGYDASDKIWTNGGQWPDGKIPTSMLTLIPSKADCDLATEDEPAWKQSIAVGVKNMTVQSDTFSIGVKGCQPPAPVPPPASIRVITPPTKTTYEDGETIDYTGMVVKAYDENGNLWTNSTHPDGVIPIAELTLDYTAEYSEQSHSEAEATVEQDNPNIMQCIKDAGVLKFGYANDATIYWHREFEQASFHHEFNDRYDFTTTNSPVYIVMLHIISAGEPTKKYYIALYSPEPFSVMVHHVREAISTHDSDIDETVEWTSSSKSFNGKTFSAVYGSTVYAEDIIEIMPSANAIDSSFDRATNRFSQLGYTILFSDVSVAMPVKYDTGGGNILETSVNITVTEVRT